MVALIDAKKIIDTAETKAVALGQSTNITVAYGGGNLLAHVSMDGAWLAAPIASAINTIVIFRDATPQRYAACTEFDAGVAQQLVIDPRLRLKTAA